MAPPPPLPQSQPPLPPGPPPPNARRRHPRGPGRTSQRAAAAATGPSPASPDKPPSGKGGAVEKSSNTENVGCEAAPVQPSASSSPTPSSVGSTGGGGLVATGGGGGGPQPKRPLLEANVAAGNVPPRSATCPLGAVAAPLQPRQKICLRRRATSAKKTDAQKDAAGRSTTQPAVPLRRIRSQAEATSADRFLSDDDSDDGHEGAPALKRRAANAPSRRSSISPRAKRHATAATLLRFGASLPSTAAAATATAACEVSTSATPAGPSATTVATPLRWYTPDCGLANMGNTCYLNSVVQCLRHMPGFVACLVGPAQRQGAARPVDASAVLHRLAELFDHMHEAEVAAQGLLKSASEGCKKAGKAGSANSVMGLLSSPTALRPSAFKEELGRVLRANAMFSGYLQHDAQELLRFLLGHLQDAQGGSVTAPAPSLAAFSSAATTLKATTVSPTSAASPPPPAGNGDEDDRNADGDETAAPETIPHRPSSAACVATPLALGTPASKTGRSHGIALPLADTAALTGTIIPQQQRLPLVLSPVPPSAFRRTEPRLSSGPPAQGRLLSAGTVPVVKGPQKCKGGLPPAFAPATAVEALFGGQLCRTTRCLECEGETTRYETFMDLSLPVSPQGGRGLVWSLEQFAGPEGERLCGENKYNCSACHTLTEAVRTTRLAALPRILTLHLNRSSHGSSKIRSQVQTPTTMRMRQWSLPACQHRDNLYRLAAVIFHSGHSAVSGHYFCCIRQDLSSATDLSVREHLKDSAVLGSGGGAPADAELSTSGSSSSLPPREVQCAPLPACYQQAYMHLDDSSVQYYSLAELQGLLSRTCQKPSTAYILFYERVEAKAAA